MNDVAEYFKQNHFAYVNNVATHEECQKALNIIFNAEENREGACDGDGQCNLSPSFYGIFDYLLQEKTEIFENALDMKLHPTYSYARIYKPDEKLGFHTDRDACEITATLNVGFLGEKTWPIYILPMDESNFHRPSFHQFNEGKSIDESYHNNYMNGKTFNSKVQIDLQVGDAAIFKGRELFHWREPYIEGAWQVQIFLHYVDAKGPFKNLKYDKRKKLQI